MVEAVEAVGAVEDKMSFKQFTKELGGKRVEGELIKTIIYSLLTSLVLLSLLYYIKLRYIQNVLPKYGFFLILTAFSYAMIMPTTRQVRAYKEMPCMSGMMVGMTIGMISGFLIGYSVGATNGMFTGSVLGMFIGISVGIWTGKCCGIMGIMEGTMAGFMGGLMGAMTSVMLIGDHLILASIIVFIASAFIMTSLNYMIYKEAKEREGSPKGDYINEIFITTILISITTWIIIYGPRSALLF